MLNSGECPKCGCKSIAGPHRIFGQHHVRIDLPGVSTATLEALTCAECGYTELYSDRLGLENIKKYGRFLNKSEGESGRICPYCGTTVRPEATYCQECGNTI
ncbi:zinc-ribbon domain-containing protein [Candidatus Thorarchaeota archaeon]|nr:MAG: zinc-ribbon domain-containing protein [Candidatus Thorarchaeota archaeon]